MSDTVVAKAAASHMVDAVVADLATKLAAVTRERDALAERVKVLEGVVADDLRTAIAQQDAMVRTLEVNLVRAIRVDLEPLATTRVTTAPADKGVAK